MSTTPGSRIMGGLQLLGRSLMLPIAVLPVAGLLLRLGQPDLLDIAFIANAGNAIFSQLALIFAIGVAVGLAEDSNGAAGLAGTIGYLVLNAVLNTLDPDINMGVLSGIIMGSVAGLLYNRYRTITLPDYLAFFGGRRFIPIATGLAGVLLGVGFGYAWPPIQYGIDQLGQWLIDGGEAGLFVYGVLNRLLIVTGLHHVLNSLVWFVFGSYDGVTGDLNRFFAGDPTAGSFMTGFFPVMMFGLPAAALAMYHAAPRAARARVGGLLLSLALTAFLTGVTEPIEFTFMFLAPVLYGVHAVMTGISMAVMHALGVKLGFTFSAGAFDYALSYGLSTRGWLLIPVGLVYFALYYAIFKWAITRFNLPTPGREPEAATTSTAEEPAPTQARGDAFVSALGGADNIIRVGACTTRLRLVMVDHDAIDETALKALGARGMLKLQGNGLQVILGPVADQVSDDIRTALPGARSAMPLPEPAPVDSHPRQATAGRTVTSDTVDREGWMAALGGVDNITRLTSVATTRLRIETRRPEAIDEAALRTLGARGIHHTTPHVMHIVMGAQAEALADILAP
ncbi:N-acetylglucosamine-specific PTS transporter subunit IIBC [Larsenimonas rhizosphaerae]|uniref:N-acetylglucosamine-specific PTS transporter subunit IIBC n=1 Tax=Larsenimonas rhizosphaerae TaxID=2944682 RepID=A0AA42CYR2_9GAMM|nr:N-acetylglucosamine-specific PTS transporter subunit IIBC [Larsenimonas rhizosphaerae]MCX2525503.1 N-acetylglucosamine-specific PTS transporter subunit IIBC [Larsenimonas rhizosphaerae]